MLQTTWAAGVLLVDARTRAGAEPIPVASADAEPSEPNSSLPAAASDTADTAGAADSSDDDSDGHADFASP